MFDSAWEKAVVGGLKKPTKQEEDHKQIIKTKCAVYLLEILFRTRHGKLFSDDYFLKEIPQSENSQGNINVLNLTQSYYHEESEKTSFEMQGKVVTKDGLAPFGPDTIARFNHIKSELNKILADIVKVE